MHSQSLQSAIAIGLSEQTTPWSKSREYINTYSVASRDPTVSPEMTEWVKQWPERVSDPSIHLSPGSRALDC
jgi:hypothetical protein